MAKRIALTHSKRPKMLKRTLVGLLPLLTLLAASTHLTQAARPPTPTPIPSRPGAAAGPEARYRRVGAAQGVEISIVVRPDGSWSGTLWRSTPPPPTLPDGEQLLQESRRVNDALPLEGENLQQMAEAALGSRDGTASPAGPVLLALSGPVRQGQALEIAMLGNPASGYSWAVEALDESALLQTGDVETRQLSPRLGAPARQIVRLRAVDTAAAWFRLAYRRPWEADAPPARRVSIQADGLDLADVCLALSAPPPAAPAVESAQEADRGDRLPSLSSTQSLPSTYDWCAAHGGCPDVKDQELCGSCWAFATVGPLEAWVKYGDWVSDIDLSEQYLISCNTDGHDCSGGLIAHEYHWWKVPPVEPEAGAVLESDYPYTASDPPCSGYPHAHPYKISSWSYVGGSSSVPPVNDIKQAIYDHGPVAAAVCVGNAFRYYSEGVFMTSGSCTYQVNHAIVLVGWNDSEQSWTLRNSWGTDWGDDGYMRIRWGTSNVGYGASYIVYNPTTPFTPTDWAYLPLTVRNFPKRLENGDFERGRDGSWSESSSHGWTLVLHSSELPLSPHGGSWAVWLGGDNSETSILSQEVTIPANATTLNYWHWLGSAESACGWDYAYTRFGATTLKTYDLCESNNTGGWVYQQIDVTGWRGQTVTLSFVVETDVVWSSSLFLDDVSLSTAVTAAAGDF